MSYPTYYVEQDDTLVHFFDTFDGGTGASITMSGFAVGDILIYKDGGVTQRSSTSGFTLLDTDGIDFDTLTGIHGFSLDLSDNTDAGFYAVGPWYHVVISSITVDGQTVSFVACAFRIVSATRGMAGTALPDAAADAAGGLPISDAGGLDLDAQKTSVDNIETDTNSLNDTKVPDTISLANINAEVDTALSDINLDHLLAVAVAGTDVVDDSVIAKLVSSGVTADWDTFVNTTDALQAIRDHVGDGTNLTEAGGDGDHLTEAGGTGDQLTAVPWNPAWDAEVESEVTDGLNAYDPPTRAELTSDKDEILAQLPSDAPVEGTADSGTTTTMVDAARTEADTDYWKGSWILFTSGSIDGQVRLITGFTPASDEITFTPATTQAVSTNTYRIIPAAQIEEVLALTGHTAQTGDSFARLGAPSGASVSADIAENQTDLDTVIADTDALQGDWADGGRLDVILDDILADTNELQTDDVPGLIAALNDLSAAAVNTEVLDVLNTDTFAEPTGVPGATVTLATKIGFLYMALRNQIDVTATKKTYYDDGGAAEWEKDLSDDGTTYSESEANAI